MLFRSGNVRELENVIQKTVVMSPGDAVIEDLIPSHVRAYLDAPAPAAEPPPAATISTGTASTTAAPEAPADADPRAVLHHALAVYADAVGPDIGRIARTAERLLIIYALNRERGVKLRAARALGINRVTLDRKLAEYRIEVRRGEGVVATEDEDGPAGC